MYTYLTINIFVILVPLVLSFDRKVHFYKSWPALWPAIIVTGLFFLIWDALFTYYGVWSFNDRYLLGIRLAGLPLEEWLFFITVPYACVFSYRVLDTYLPLQPNPRFQRIVSYAMVIILLVAAAFYYDRIYTLLTFILTSLFIIIVEWYAKATYLLRIYRAYLVMLVPFIIVNGILTGTGLEEPVVSYNNNENMSLRLLTIPLEDMIYGFLLVGLNITLMERIKASQ